MMELTINGQVYQFNAGIGFMRKMNQRASVNYEGTSLKRDTGLTYLVADLMDGDIETLILTLDAMNEGKDPRLTRKQIEDFLEDENTDIDKVFQDVLDFLKKSNCTKRTVLDIEKAVQEKKEQQEKQGQQNQ